MIDLKKVSTPRLLVQLKMLRSKIVQPWNHYHHEDEGSMERYEDDQAMLEAVKTELATREHYPRGKEGRKARQQAKQNR